MNSILSVCFITLSLGVVAGAQTATLTASGTISLTPSGVGAIADVNGTGTASLTGYGSATLTISGTYDSYNATAESLNFAFDFGGGDVLRGSGHFTMPPSNGYPGWSATLTIGPGSGRFANEIGSFPALNANGTNGSFALSGVGMLSVAGQTAALAFSRTDIAIAGGNGASQAIAADFNGDSIKDLAVFTSSNGTLSILLGNGDGTFQSHPYTGLSPNPSYIGVADLNGDTKADILLEDSNAVISTLLGNGDGSFQQAKAQQYNLCCGLAIGDWNGDKILDVAAAEHSLVVGIGKGDGSFGAFAITQSPGPYGGGSGIATADVNGDGKADLIVANFIFPQISVFLGNGDGTFQSPLNIVPSTAPSGPLVLGDINADGKPDLIFADNNRGIHVMLGNGDGTFRASVVLISGSNALAIGDVNGDGKLDLIVAADDGGIGTGKVYVFLGNNDGTFLVPQTFPVDNSPSSLSLADLNRDGKTDIVTANQVGKGISVLLNTGTYDAVSAAPVVTTNPTDQTVHIGDLVTFSASAAGSPAPAVQWQVSVDQGGSFSDIPDATAGTYSFTAAAAQNGYQYRAVFTNASGSAMSSTAKLTLLLPSLNLQLTHTGDFAVGQQNATYQITLSNQGNGTLTGMVIVFDTVPPGLTLVSMSGPGWTCPGQPNFPVQAGANSCSRIDELAPGASDPPITVTVNVADNARSPLVNVASAISSFPASANASDSTVIVGGVPTGLGYFTMTPCRAVDTRSSQSKTGDFGPPAMGAYAGRAFPLLQSGCGLSSAAQAYSLNFTVVPTGRLDFLSAWPSDHAYPGVSTLNSPDGKTIANAAIVPNDPNGSITVTTGESTDLIIDVNGYFAPPNGNELMFYPVTPCRVADTRASQSKTGPFGPPALVAYHGRDFPITSSSCNIPTSAQAYSLNVTAVPPGPLDFLSTWPAGKPFPNVSTLNTPDGSVIANAAIVPAGINGAVSVTAGNPTDVIIDINGYFAPPGAPGALHFYPVTPCRVMDTRPGQGKGGAFGPPGLTPYTGRNVPIVSSGCGIPTTAQAYSLNFTVVPSGALDFLSAWPASKPFPNVSTLNSPKGATIANAAIVPAGTNGDITVTAGNATDLIIDINGYFAP